MRNLVIAVGLMMAPAAANGHNLAAAPPAAATVADINVDQQEYGQWLGRVQAAYVPVFSALQAIQAAHGEEMALPVARRLALLRPRAAAFIELVARAEAELAAIDRPDVASLALAPALQPDAFTQEVGGALRSLRTIVTSMVATLDHAAAGRVTALERTVDRFSDAVRYLNQTQIRFAEARMNAMSPDLPGHYVGGIDLSVQRFSQLLLASTGQSSRTLGADLEALARELGQWMDTGFQRIASMEQEYSRLSAIASPGSAEALVIDRNLRILPFQRAQLEAGRDMVGIMRRLAADLPGAENAPYRAGMMSEVRSILERVVRNEQSIAGVWGSDPQGVR